MKKFTAILVMTAMLCSLVSCGHDTADEIESSVTSVAEETTEETAEEITETDEVTDGEEISENEPSENTEDYKNTLEMFLDCNNNHDVDGAMKFVFPYQYIDTIKFMEELSGDSIDALMYDSEESGKTVRLSEIISEETLDDNDIEAFYQYYGAIQLVSDYIDETGKENIDLEKYSEKLKEWAHTVDREQLPETYFKLNHGRKVICLLEYEDEDGDTYTEEQAFTMFYIDGEGWKVD